MASKVLVLMGLVLAGSLAARAAAEPVAAASPSSRPATQLAAPQADAMPAELQAFLDAHPVSQEAVRQALAKWRAQRAASGVTTRIARPEIDRAGGRAEAVQPRVSAADEVYTTVIDDFEDPVLDPNLWVVGDLDNELHGEYYWGLSQCRASQGVQSLWSVGAGKDGSKLGCDSLYPSGANSYALLVLDMSRFPTPPSQLDILLDYWLNTRIVDEAGVVPDGLFVSWMRPVAEGSERVVLKAVTSQYPERFFNDPMRIDLVQAEEIYEPKRTFDLTKEPVVLIEFLFMSRDPVAEEPPPTTFQGGVFIDNVRLVSDVQPNLARALPIWDPAGMLPVLRDEE